MASKYHSSTTTTYNANDKRLDELLEDLQSTVATRPTLNGTTDYRETYKSVSSQQNGQPTQTAKEYEIEYLSPSNSTTLVRERCTSPFINQDSNGICSKPGTYKTVSYEYSSSTKNRKTTSQSGTPVFDQSIENQNEKSESKLRNNIKELDTLLDDMNYSRNSEYNTSTSNQTNRYNTYDSGFMEPLDHSTPHKASHVSKIEQKTVEEKRFGSSSPMRHTQVKKEIYYNGQPTVDESYCSGDNEPRRDLVFTGGSLRNPEPSPEHQLQQEVYHYETKTSTRNLPPNVPQRGIYNCESDVTDSIDRRTSPDDCNHSPSPVRSVHNYSSTVKDTTTHRSPSPARSYYSSSSNVATRTVTPQPTTRAIYTRNEIIQETTRRRISQRSPTTPPPHRSPSPQSFSQAPYPTAEYSSKNYIYERNVRPESPTQRCDPIPGRSVVTRNYKYSSQSTQNSRYPTEGHRPQPVQYSRPFPGSAPQPEIKEQKPPKQLDELMASFKDSESHYRESHNKYDDVNTINRRRSNSPSPAKSSSKIQIGETQKLNETTKPNDATGPPVYYPPGPLFTKKEECGMMCEGAAGKGKMKANRKAMYKYKAGSEMKESTGTKKTVVPFCLPVCCALPCVIM